MSFLRLLLLLLVGLVVRRLYLAFKSVKAGGYPSPDHGQRSRDKGPKKPKRMDDLTEQDISDADFEEIP
jgi:hypothetical protein